MCSWDTTEEDVDAFVEAILGVVGARGAVQATNTAGYDAPIGLTADPVVFTLLDGRLCVLLARRLEEPQRGMFALPGGFVGAPRRPSRRRSASCARRPASARCTSSSCAPTPTPRATRAAGCPRSPTWRWSGPRRCRRSGPRPRRLLASARRAARAGAGSRHDRRRRPLAAARARGRQGLVRAQGARAADRAVHAAPGAAALRGAARGGGRRGQLPPRRPRHRAAGGHRLPALRGPGPPGRLYRRA